MKLCSDRKYKNDLSDIISILYEHEKRSKKLLVQFEEDYPKVMNTENASAILESLKRKKRKNRNTNAKRRQSSRRLTIS